ncbi:hypothetical protein PTKIN_Ptkin16aG0030900 [Pterospermum kingtungense]
MEDGDIIDVIEWVRYTVAPQSTFITLPRLKGEIPILIEVQAEEGVARADHYNRFYMMGRNTPLRNLLLDYCDRVSAFYECMRFRLRDSYVNPDKTADDLDLVDGDIIFSIHVLIYSSMVEAEAYAACQALDFAADLGFRGFNFEVLWVSDPSKVPWRLRSYRNHIVDLKSKLNGLEGVYVGREANQVADMLAKEGMERCDDLLEVKEG